MDATLDFQAMTRDFGSDVLLNAVPVRGLLDETPAEAFGLVGGSAPCFLLRTADHSADPRGLTLTVGARAFTVRDWTPDGTGVTALQLEAQ